MTATAKVQFVWNHRSGLPEDRCINTFYFHDDTGDIDAADAAVMFDRLEEFYKTPVPSGSALYPFLSRALSGTYTIRAYDLTDVLPRAPVSERVGNVGAFSGNTNLPQEVAVCLSFQGAAKSGVPQSRRRGRIYLGPLDGTALTMGASAAPSVSTALKDTLAEAADRLAGYTGSIKWVVHSKYATAGDDGNDTFVTNGWIDNAFDTQRRRGQAPTTRTIWAV